MATDSLVHHASLPAEAAEPDRFAPDWGEHLVTVVASALAVLVVALIALLLGMA